MKATQGKDLDSIFGFIEAYLVCTISIGPRSESKKAWLFKVIPLSGWKAHSKALLANCERLGSNETLAYVYKILRKRDLRVGLGSG